eukprot:Protomagalhaensia_sp_Gyna_25__5611@NODE_779_length_2635_cov_41_902928_g611_i0_p1_GENE_NODE_779_length_2635_cov_41_902928_g611_i0NODE_779_length_2635_cov_41_902928_g611_i0_p1_ORF_typecomplete_len480_score70_69Amidohydro_1/PF01979_20/3_3e24Amidohydro_3/PF07969_11/13Amidohydro_3/PF07969_11/3_3e08_NODE_779_length_2635_cov_41_902928_g611_i05051944
MEAILFHNCRILRGQQLVRDELWVNGGRIISAEEGMSLQYRTVNCANKIITPGFIDIQVNGAFGVDFSTTRDIEKALAQASHFLPFTGVTGYCPTVITSTPETYTTRVPALCFRQGGAAWGASVLGGHLEGPFISRVKRGCHPIDLVQNSIVEEGDKASEQVPGRLHRMYGTDLSNVSIITLAPELPGAAEAIKYLSFKQGIVVSMGHSESDFSTGERGLLSGASALTHLFSAMNAFGHREPALPGLICSRLHTPFKPTKLLNIIVTFRKSEPPPHIQLPEGFKSPGNQLVDRMTDQASPVGRGSDLSNYCPSQLYYGLIADCGVHIHPSTLRIAYRLNKQGLCLITDAISALGLPDGNYNIGQVPIEVFGKPRRAYVQGTETLAGVVASMDECVRFFVKTTQCPLAYALTAASLHPAEMLGVSSIKGHLNPGADADFLIIDDDVRVFQTWINGELAYDVGNPPEDVHIEETEWMQTQK